MKKILQVVLLLIVAIGLGFAIGRNALIVPENKAQASPVVDRELTNEPCPVVLVTYFTTNVRCDSCKSIEALTRQAVEEYFSEDLSNGSVLFRTLNIDLPENEHYVEDYQLSFKTVVVSAMRDGREVKFIKMDKVWELLSEPEAFMNYIVQGIQQTEAIGS